MRKTTKSELYNQFTTSLYSEALYWSFTFVVDGGFLLHQVSWPHGCTYGGICNIYLKYIQKHFGSSVYVVFDGYNNELLGVKSYERYRRREKNVAADIDFDENMLVTLTQAQFLSNVCNKQKFVNLLANYLHQFDVEVRKADEDADTLIVQTALDLHKRGIEPVAVVGNDVDLLILLTALTPDLDNMRFYKAAPLNKEGKLYSTSDHKHLKPFILFAHAFCGCDTTSALYNKGKKSIVNILTKNSDLQLIVQTFYKPQSTESEIYAAGEKLILFLYSKDKKDSCLDELRYKRFVSLAAHGSHEIRLAQLPPTKAAALQHCKRVYYQIQQWLRYPINAEQWGWTKRDNLMVPVMTTDQPAPEKLLQLVSRLFRGMHLLFSPVPCQWSCTGL